MTDDEQKQRNRRRLLVAALLAPDLDNPTVESMADRFVATSMLDDQIATAIAHVESYKPTILQAEQLRAEFRGPGLLTCKWHALVTYPVSMLAAYPSLAVAKRIGNRHEVWHASVVDVVDPLAMNVVYIAARTRRDLAGHLANLASVGVRVIYGPAKRDGIMQF
jgi:hypothetical protein